MAGSATGGKVNVARVKRLADVVVTVRVASAYPLDS